MVRSQHFLAQSHSFGKQLLCLLLALFDIRALVKERICIRLILLDFSALIQLWTRYPSSFLYVSICQRPSAGRIKPMLLFQGMLFPFSLTSNSAASPGRAISSVYRTVLFPYYLSSCLKMLGKLSSCLASFLHPPSLLPSLPPSFFLSMPSSPILSRLFIS